jgi:hypothetical protein
MHDWLSHMNGKGCNWSNLRSFMSCVNYTTSFAMKITTMYSASIEERVIVVCFLHCHEIAPPISRNMYSDVDLWKSWSPS